MDQLDIVSQLDSNINSNSALETLMQVDNVLERLNVYAYKNWIEGEVVEGPRIERYWVTVTLMYPRQLMPDPRGAERIINFGGKVYYAKDRLVTAAKLVDPEDREVMDGADGMRPGQPRAKKVERPVWLVTLEIPRTAMDDLVTAKKQTDDMNIDTDAVENAYDDGLGDEDAIRAK
jgi:hypothetical protein